MNGNSAIRLALATALAFSAMGARAAQSVFKCTGSTGVVVFSPQPCGKDAKQVDTSAALKTGTAPNLQGVSDMAAMSSIDVQCKNRARAISDLAAADIQAANIEIQRMQEEMRLSMNNGPGATRDNGLRSQLSAAEDRKATAIGTQRRDLAQLQKDCDAQRVTEARKEQDRDDHAHMIADHAAQKATAAAAASQN